MDEVPIKAGRKIKGKMKKLISGQCLVTTMK